MKIKLAFNRVFAFVFDYIIIAAYIGLLIYISVFIFDAQREPSGDFSAKLQGHALAFFTLTFPVWLYFTVMEAGRSSATIGKRLRRLQVRAMDGSRAGWPSIALRNALKFLPWEIAHAAIWYIPGRPFIDAMPMPNILLSLFANVLAITFVLSLFVGSGRTLYDRLSNTQVVAKKKIQRG